MKLAIVTSEDKTNKPLLKALDHTRIRIKSMKWNTKRATSKRFLQELGERMVSLCLQEEGVGLAAPQIGLNQQLFIIRDMDDIGKSLDAFVMYFNPSWKAVNLSKKEKSYEGCLSVPGQIYNVERYEEIVATWDDFDETTGKFTTVSETMKGWKARVFQHEYDHLVAKSIVDRGERVSLVPIVDDDTDVISE